MSWRAWQVKSTSRYGPHDHLGSPTCVVTKVSLLVTIRYPAVPQQGNPDEHHAVPHGLEMQPAVRQMLVSTLYVRFRRIDASELIGVGRSWVYKVIVEGTCLIPRSFPMFNRVLPQAPLFFRAVTERTAAMTCQY